MMKKIYNYILLSVLAIASAGCINEELTPDQPSAEAGDEVKFGLSLGDPKTRTIYGDETTITEEQADGTSITKTVFPIYWVNGDKVQVFSPQCLEGKKSAEYEVVLPSGVTNPYYADDLTPTGVNGVQWGGNATADFYSLYPSGSYTLSSDGTKAENITINYTQSINVNGTSVKSDMEDCLMYAKTTAVTRGSVVNLHYDPISTVVMVTLKVAENAFGTDAESFTVQSISLIAPDGTDIAGTFSLNISDGTFGGFAEGKSSNTIISQIVNSSTGGFHTLSNGKSITIPLFLAPAAYSSVDGWQVKVVANGITYTKTLKINKPLVAGQIHKITLPELAPDGDEWDVSKWMTYIPRNVYLSEVSIPGSWNTLNTDYQSDTSIVNQYTAGVRGFHFDTRWRTDDTESNWAGYLEGSINGLSVAGGASSDNYNSAGGGRVVSGNAKTFAEYLAKITQNVKSDEYMVLTCTFAQDSYQYTDANGNDWVGAISNACKDNPVVYDAKLITENTLVGDVLGSVIVIINMEGEISSVPANSKCLFVNMPLTLNSNLFNSTLNEFNYGAMFKASANSTTPTESKIDMYHTQAQISINEENTSYSGSGDRSNVQGRGYAPTIGERKMVANNILSWSKSNYDTENYAHNKWIYLGLGGYNVKYTDYFLTGSWDEVKGSNATVGDNLNNWINSKVSEMGTTPSGQTDIIPYYPVGIVLMNFVNDHASTVKNILLLNNKYRMQYDSTKPSDYDPKALSLAEYGSTATTGGDAF